MTALLQQRSDGYFYASLIKADGSCYTEYFYETLLEAFWKWRKFADSL